MSSASCICVGLFWTRPVTVNRGLWKSGDISSNIRYNVKET